MKKLSIKRDFVQLALIALSLGSFVGSLDVSIEDERNENNK